MEITDNTIPTVKNEIERINQNIFSPNAGASIIQ